MEDLPNDPDNVYGSLAYFVVDKKIGKGQFSEVYRARCNNNGSIVALKKVQVESVCTLSWLSPMHCTFTAPVSTVVNINHESNQYILRYRSLLLICNNILIIQYIVVRTQPVSP